MRQTIILGIAVLAQAAAPVYAQSGKTVQDRANPAAIKEIDACRSISDSTARLACFDAAAAKLAGAIESKELVVVEQQEVKKTKRSLFGFRLPDLAIFGDKGSEDDQQLTTTIAQASQGKNGRWNITTAEGAIWQTTEPVPFLPRNGDAIEIRSAALGSFFLKLRGGRSVRAIRVQ